MDVNHFVILTMLVVPMVLVAVAVLLSKGLSAQDLRRPPVRIAGTAAVLGAVGLPVATMVIDAQGAFFGDGRALIGAGLGVPEDIAIRGQKGDRLGDCWSNQVRWSLDLDFGSPGRLDQWFDRAPWRGSLAAQIARYYDIPVEQVSIAPGALDQRVKNHAGAQNVPPARPGGPWSTAVDGERLVCAAIHERGGGRGLDLRPCDPAALAEDDGSKGWVLLRRGGVPGTLTGSVRYRGGPAYCTNPLRRSVNAVLGLPHPPGEPTQFSGL
ncbi:hypothetical protein [Porphyrobacter sp. AAP82]|uniref:hypothetical protein n=1 Tax=Porphyrobacter sp. AAP82 TaxID=1248917 RepID=UPI000309FFB7|nr:hypothetical protein [Porphyrobacter sp. AAP82]